MAAMEVKNTQWCTKPKFQKWRCNAKFGVATPFLTFRLFTPGLLNTLPRAQLGTDLASIQPYPGHY